VYGEGERAPCGVYVSIASKADFTSNEEPRYSKWLLTRESTEEADFNVHLRIEWYGGWSEYKDEADELGYEAGFAYNDLCYAVANALTSAMKEYGFYGYHDSTYEDTINVHQLLLMKAVALDAMQAHKLND
jgi:hypothetical protein